MIVIDASTITKFVLKEEGWEEVAEYLRDGTSSVDHIVKESVNAIWMRFRRGEMSLTDARITIEALKEILDKAVRVEGELPYLDEAVNISFSQGVTIYDSLYIAMAKKKGLQLVTADEIQANAAAAEKMSVTLLR